MVLGSLAQAEVGGRDKCGRRHGFEDGLLIAQEGQNDEGQNGKDQPALLAQRAEEEGDSAA